MNLYKSALSDSPDDQTTSAPSWSFGGLIKTLATKSESVIGSYRRDFEEFGSELKKETSVIRQVASRAVKEFPDSLEIGASVAQESLESVGQAIDDIGATVWKSTAEMISHGKESLLSSSSSSADPESSDNRSSDQGFAVKAFSRFEMQLLAIQSDKGTYSREPDDSGDFENWNLGFELDEKSSEIAKLMDENKPVKEIYEELVPGEVDAETFWRRYFYRVYRLEQAEEARVKLIKSAILGGEEEDFSWDLDDEGDESAKSSVVELKSNENLAKKDRTGEERGSEEEAESSREVSSKDSDISVISTQPSLPEVEDLGWDKMEEDIRSNEDKSLEAGQGTEKKSDWRKRVSVAEDDEDLTWDIEDEK